MVNDSVWITYNIEIILQVPNWLISSVNYDASRNKKEMYLWHRCNLYHLNHRKLYKLEWSKIHLRKIKLNYSGMIFIEKFMIFSLKTVTRIFG